MRDKYNTNIVRFCITFRLWKQSTYLTCVHSLTVAVCYITTCFLFTSCVPLSSCIEKIKFGLWDHLVVCLSVYPQIISESRKLSCLYNFGADYKENTASKILRVVFYAVLVVSKESRWSVLSRTPYLLLISFPFYTLQWTKSFKYLRSSNNLSISTYIPPPSSCCILKPGRTILFWIVPQGLLVFVLQFHCPTWYYYTYTHC